VCVFFSTLGLLLCLSLAPDLGLDGFRYGRWQALAAVMLLACQWLLPPQRESAHPDVIIPVLIFCVGVCQALGITDVLTLWSLSAFWLAISFPASSKTWGRCLGAMRALAMVAVYAWVSGKSHAAAAVALGVMVPWLIFVLAKRQSAGFVIATIAVAVLSQPFADPAMLGFWGGVMALAGAFVSVLMRKTAGRMAARFNS
jgi:hypothetical protein